MKIAIVTPYSDEPASWVARACTSVLEQTVPVTHVLVSDGPRRTDLTGVANSVSVHLELPTPASDSGATPRVIGGRWAVENGYDIVCYLDADDALDRVDRGLEGFGVAFLDHNGPAEASDGKCRADHSFAVGCVVLDPRRRR